MVIFSPAKQYGRAAGNWFRVAFLFCLCTFLFLGSSCSQTSGPASTSSPEAAPRAAGPPQVTQIDDAKVKELLKPAGKPLLVNFWATWCGPCREEFPDLVKVDHDYRGKIDFITVSLDFIEKLDSGVPKFLSEMNASMPTYLLVSADENTFISSIDKDWGGGLPFTILYNEKGEAAFSRQGKVDRETLQGEIEKILDGSN